MFTVASTSGSLLYARAFLLGREPCLANLLKRHCHLLAVDLERFLAIGGYDRLYHPGRIEDLDLGFRGWMAGWKG